ncbi:hypothetical protein [Streptomyces sp. NPDC096132]|uniref:hypothetical protein n=1 Tax=Streptomyces sp. NPDC096132 TaxID=3366075 RepID=UPI0038296966
MNPPTTVRDGVSPSQGTPVRQFGAVIPLWRAAETHGLNPTPARCASDGHGAAVLVGGATR